MAATGRVRGGKRHGHGRSLGEITAVTISGQSAIAIIYGRITVATTGASLLMRAIQLIDYPICRCVLTFRGQMEAMHGEKRCRGICRVVGRFVDFRSASRGVDRRLAGRPPRSAMAFVTQRLII